MYLTFNVDEAPFTFEDVDITASIQYELLIKDIYKKYIGHEKVYAYC